MKMKEKIKEKDIEEFCKQLVFTSVYHKHRGMIKVAQDSIEPANRAENQPD